MASEINILITIELDPDAPPPDTGRAADRVMLGVKTALEPCNLAITSHSCRFEYVPETSTTALPEMVI